MSGEARRATRFRTSASDAPGWVPIVRRNDLDAARVDALLTGVDAVDWGSLAHAYGTARDVPALLPAVVVGDGRTRTAAWDALIGSVGHQGSVYTCTPAVTRVLADVAAWHAHPARAEAIAHLQFLAASRDPRADGDEIREAGLLSELRATAAGAVDALAPGWRHEPPAVRRALVWLLTTAPDRAPAHIDLVEEVLPPEHREAWRWVLEGRDLDDHALMDRVEAFEAWAHGG